MSIFDQFDDVSQKFNSIKSPMRRKRAGELLELLINHCHGLHHAPRYMTRYRFERALVELQRVGIDLFEYQNSIYDCQCTLDQLYSEENPFYVN